ncbi:hypothetical protein CTEN210_03268 [Chaetoceros tenuissimus]|uniref:SPX domain-containing protein n=1 Tax=Chaetoceros tenuissimus TaxID=426638 RepID=A0AAD3CJF7_9STRA|nr:hypothetical protein CTEN210_03268 [Chaetoceros tenuissimus]
MKFCKNLQQIVEISDPAWAPYWTNYKMLKKLIKELPSLVPSDEENSTSSQVAVEIKDETNTEKKSAPLHLQLSGTLNKEKTNQTTEKKRMGKSPGEIAFFKLLHSELKKAAKFFEHTKQEFILREGRLREGMEIIRKPNSIMVPDKWSTMAKSIYRLYKDLLLLELYAIMTYCSFSKILKKHDKVTGFDTRIAFMANVVNKANFTRYPEVLEMIQRCEKLFEEVSQKLLMEGTSALCEDEKLFISMIHRFYGQIMDKAEEEGRPSEGNNIKRNSLNGAESAAEALKDVHQKLDTTRDDATKSLKSLVEENDSRSKAESIDPYDSNQDGSSDQKNIKRSLEITSAGQNSEITKRLKK